MFLHVCESVQILLVNKIRAADKQICARYDLPTAATLFQMVNLYVTKQSKLAHIKFTWHIK